MLGSAAAAAGDQRGWVIGVGPCLACGRKNMAWKGEKSSGCFLEKTETQPQWGLHSWKEAERRKWGVCSQREKDKVDKKWVLVSW